MNKTFKMKPIRKAGVVTIGGDEYEVVYNGYAILKLEKEYNIKLTDLQDRATDADFMYKVVLVGLNLEDETLEIEDFATAFEDITELINSYSVCVQLLSGVKNLD